MRTAGWVCCSSGRRSVTVGRSTTAGREIRVMISPKLMRRGVDSSRLIDFWWCFIFSQLICGRLAISMLKSDNGFNRAYLGPFRPFCQPHSECSAGLEDVCCLVLVFFGKPVFLTFFRLPEVRVMQVSASIIECVHIQHPEILVFQRPARGFHFSPQRHTCNCHDGETRKRQN